ncbi:Ger(x)C family spore germination protein [Paenibacillus typhae]|uniref:Spore germination protein KC n=1 Tax=Paenibacillus typhae TaxID=1174501 RepID=A0A1G8XB12_9BACL|nr:Ger(x)C family spore germination protein [Paenibacillus typhae]SDJ87792.1 spore germination protein KC [Paenibacillus typhae]
MKKSSFSLVLLIAIQLVIPLVLAGCWDSVELNRRAIVSGVAIDRGEGEAEKYVLSFQVIVADEISGENTRGISPVALYTGKGHTMFEALANASRQTARFLSLGHIRVLVISEKVAQEGIKDMMDVLERESDTRLTSLMFISKGQQAREIMSTMTVFSKIPANDLVEKLDTTSKQFGYNYRMEVDDVIRGIQLRGGGPVINGVIIDGSREGADTNDNMKTIAPHAVIKVTELAAFKDDRLKGWLKGNTALGTALLHNKIKGYPAVIRYPGSGFIAFNVYQSQLEVRVKAADPEHPVFIVKISQQVSIKESPNSLDLTSPETLQNLSPLLIEDTATKIRAAIETAKKYKSDYIGFGQVMERKNPQGWKKVRDHWEDVFAACEFRIEADAVIRHTDIRSNSFQINP